MNTFKIGISKKSAAKKNFNLNRLIPILAACWTIALAGVMFPTAANADIIYNIVNNPAVQNGYTLSGTITTDGKTGEIFPQDILTWNFLVSNGFNTYSANSSDPGSSVGMGPVGGIIATSDYLALPSSTILAPYGFVIWNTAALVQWTGSTLQDGAFTSASKWNSGWPWWQDHITTTPHDVPGGWAIADNGTLVPEPSVNTLLLLSFVVSIVCRKQFFHPKHSASLLLYGI